MSHLDWCGVLLAVGFVLAASASGAFAAGEGKRIVLQPRQGHMNASIQVPGRRGWVFVAGIPETIGCREKMLLNFPEIKGKLRWTGPDEAGAIESTWTKEGVVKYVCRLVPAGDHVDVEFAITNLSKKLYHDVWAFNCLNPVAKDSPFKDWKLQRTYMSAHGRPFLMKAAERLEGHMPTLQFFLHEQTPWGQESPFLRGFHATSPARTDGSWIVTLSDPAGSYMAATSLDSLYLFDNLDRCCIHSAPNFGDIGPGQTSFTVCRLYLADGGLADFLARYKADCTKLAARQKWARPKRGRIKLAGVAPPRRGRSTGPLAFTMQADWMADPVRLRLPETLHSSLGLLFIDHDRRDMPPLSKLAPFPTWTLDKATGEVSYTARTEGVEFGARARPYADEIYVEFRVTNRTDKTLRHLHPQVCLSMSGSKDFGRKNDVTDTCTWIGGKWTSLAKTTPSAEEKGRPPWLQVRTKDAPPLRGKRDNPDGWWVVDQLADLPVIARLSADGKHMLATVWDGSINISTNSRIPCLHSAAAWIDKVEPGGEVFWRGKIYLVPNDPKALLLRYTGDSGRWPYPEGPRPRRPRKRRTPR